MATKKSNKVETPSVLEQDDDLLAIGDDEVDPEVVEDVVTDDDDDLEVEAPVTSGVVSNALNNLDDILNEIVDVEEGIEKPTILIYGKNGTGKTTIGGSTDGVLVLAPEEGTLSLRGKGKNVKKLRVDTAEKLEKAYWLLYNGKRVANGIEIMLPNKKTKKLEPFVVTAITTDTLTKLIQVVLRSVVLGSAASNPNKDVVSPTLKDWGTMSQKITYWLMMYKELPVVKIWLVQEGNSGGELEDDEFSIFPDLNKALRNAVMAEADIIGRTFLMRKDNETKFAISFKPNNRYITKDRTGALTGKIFINPTLDKLYERIYDTSK